ncbi:hypothetical protein PR048_013989 [Dryococelus australis]|uniref:Uncharacterized protein n=1 Tax=Dryococelus australis TaxID=614101 RepID=A0ABQ9HTV6_9NEOP|nr:hypothetical protein PR048_013989 [Dryococelus australis]
MKLFLVQCGHSVDANGDETAMKLKVVQKFREEYKNECHHCHVFSAVCIHDFSVAHWGRDDCRKHISSQMHIDFVKLQVQEE